MIAEESHQNTAKAGENATRLAHKDAPEVAEASATEESLAISTKIANSNEYSISFFQNIAKEVVSQKDQLMKVKE